MQAHIHEFNDVHIQQTGVQSSQQYITLYLNRRIHLVDYMTQYLDHNGIKRSREPWFDYCMLWDVSQ